MHTQQRNASRASSLTGAHTGPVRRLRAPAHCQHPIQAPGEYEPRSQWKAPFSPEFTLVLHWGLFGAPPLRLTQEVLQHMQWPQLQVCASVAMHAVCSVLADC